MEPQVNGEPNIFDLFLSAGPLVKVVMSMLLAMSLISWMFILQRTWFLKRSRHAVDQFEDQFWSGSDLSKLYEKIISRGQELSGLSHIFTSGFKEYARLRKQAGVDGAALMEGTQRAMRVALARETDKLENHLSFLATVGSISPYIGLFGTVWGIMHSFIALGGKDQATLSMVAPGIAEALVATAMGLFAAIPAVVAYNRFSNAADRLYNQYQMFTDEFSSILHRQAHVIKPGQHQ
jgi:biopolymer transport protein TolQ